MPASWRTPVCHTLLGATQLAICLWYAAVSKIYSNPEHLHNLLGHLPPAGAIVGTAIYELTTHDINPKQMLHVQATVNVWVGGGYLLADAFLLYPYVGGGGGGGGGARRRQRAPTADHWHRPRASSPPPVSTTFTAAAAVIVVVVIIIVIVVIIPYPLPLLFYQVLGSDLLPQLQLHRWLQSA